MAEANAVPANNGSQPSVNQGGSVNLGRHQAQCSICTSPHRQQIEQAWINWNYPNYFQCQFGVSRDALYRHAHAFDLFSKRRDNVCLALDKMIERVDLTDVTGPVILSAIKLLAKLHGERQGVDKAPVTDAEKLPKHKSPAEGEIVAEGGSFSESHSGVEAATPDDRQNEENENQDTETIRLQ